MSEPCKHLRSKPDAEHRPEDLFHEEHECSHPGGGKVSRRLPNYAVDEVCRGNPSQCWTLLNEPKQPTE